MYHFEKKLDKNDVVIGPATDGGYYLIGLKKLHLKIFDNKNWGTSTVREDTLKNLEKVDVHLLPMLNDIDVIEDIKNHSAFTKFLKRYLQVPYFSNNSLIFYRSSDFKLSCLIS